MAERPPERPAIEGLGAELLDRYLAGACTEDEAALVRRQLMARPDAARLLDAYLCELDAGASAQPAPDAATSWASLRERMRAADGAMPSAANARETPRTATTPASPAPRHRRSFEVPQVGAFMSWWPGVAAAAAVVIAAFALERSVPHQPAANQKSAGTYATAAMQRAEVRLADGTRVRLAPQSHLRVAADFGAERRDVFLEGEAYFDVVHDERPFTVYAGNASARDLGTAFSVRSYSEEEAVRVVVREGEVALSGVGRLAAGDVGRLTSRGVPSIQHGADVGVLLGWLEGRLGFVDAPLGHVLHELRRWHGTEVVLADSALAALPFTGTLNGARPSVAIDLVASTLGLTVRRDDTRFALSRTRGRTPRAPVVAP